jgi:hypothetical protein
VEQTFFCRRYVEPKTIIKYFVVNWDVTVKIKWVFHIQACGNMFKLMQGYSAETSGGLLICLPREQAAAYCKVRLTLKPISWYNRSYLMYTQPDRCLKLNVIRFIFSYY